MKVTVPENQAYTNTKLFYVQSEAYENDKYTVVKIAGNKIEYFCQCQDFFIRRLPRFGTPAFSYCKHIHAVKQFETTATKPGVILFVDAPKKYEVWCIESGKPFQSNTVGGQFESPEDARRAIETKHKLVSVKDYVIRESKS